VPDWRRSVMPFVPIELDDYVEHHVKANPGSDRAEVRSRLEATLAAARAGARCDCGAPIWVIGAAEVGHMCFTCITGEATPTDDCELVGAPGHEPPQAPTSSG
jgi:hypothetical protein